MNIDEIRAGLAGPDPKLFMAQVLAQAKNMPKPLLAMVYMRLQTMKPDEIRAFGNKAFEAIALVENGQIDDLEKSLSEWGIPPAIQTIIMNYANAINQNK
jgi:hypothetical protein